VHRHDHTNWQTKRARRNQAFNKIKKEKTTNKQTKKKEKKEGDPNKHTRKVGRGHSLLGSTS
jgi:hypothetical protein